MDRGKNYHVMNHLLLRNFPKGDHMQYSFLVHSSIYEMVKQYLARSGITILQQLGSYELIVGAHKFDMEMIVLGSESRAPMAFSVFKNLLNSSQLTHFWDEKITLFQEVNRYYLLEDFIANNDLNKHVISVKEISGVNSSGLLIKVFTFDSTIQRDELLNNFERFLRIKRIFLTHSFPIGHYYFTNAFPWHQPEMFLMYSIPFRNQRIFLGFQTFLTCMRELTYTRDPHLDLISLCSLKLAFCDDRNFTEASCDLEYEIDALIERFLRRMQQNQTYIQDGNFDLSRYVIDTNCSLSKSYLAIVNLVYTFQHMFHRNNLPVVDIDYPLEIHEFSSTLKLIDENKGLKRLRDSSNISYVVDGEYYKNMNSRLFCELLKCRNVCKIRLDTNYKWTNEPYLVDFGGNDYSRWIRIELVGTNQFNFIEDFIQFLKTIPISLLSEMTLVIEEATLKSYNIFKNLEIKQLCCIASMITFTMLTELSDSLVKILKINFEDCTIEDQTCTWSVLINEFNRRFVIVHILEGENTWQQLFENITNYLTKFKCNEFQFKCELSIECQNYTITVSDGTKFMFDEFHTKLEMRDSNGQMIDLYYLKNFGVHNETNDGYENFEFYQ